MSTALARPHTVQETLARVRARIDRIDRRLLTLLNQRAALAIRVGQLKRHGQQPVYDREREDTVLTHVMHVNAGPLPDDGLKRIFREILRQSRTLQAVPRRPSRPHALRRVPRS